MELKHNGFVGNDSIKNFVVIEIPNTSKNELYKNTLVYLNNIYVNPQKVLIFVENESIIESGTGNIVRNYYINDKDSPNPSEINCIWLFNGKDSYLS